jgi:hypothetical protein
MIRIRNKDDFEVFVSVPGTQATGDKYFYTVPFNCYLKALYAKVGTAGTTGAQTVEITDEGVTIFTSALISFATTPAVDPTYGPLVVDPHYFTKGDRIVVNVAAVHSTPATDLALVLVLTRTKPRRTLTGELDQALGF